MGPSEAKQEMEKLLEEGLVHYGANRVQEAVACWRRVLAIHPGDDRALDYLAAAGEVEEPQYDTAKTLEIVPGEGATEAAPRQPSAAKTLAAMLEAKRYDEALHFLYAMRERAPGDASVSRAIRFVKDRLILEYSGRIGNLDGVPRVAVGPERLNGLGFEERELLKWIDGIATYGDVIEACRLGQFRTYRLLARFLDSGILEEGGGVSEETPRGASDPAVATDGGYVELFNEATRAYLKRDYEQAERLFVQCERIRPDDARVIHNLNRLRSRK